MKRFTFLLAIIVLIVLFSGCSLVINTLRRVIPHPTPATVLVTQAATLETAPADGPEASSSPEDDATGVAPTQADQTEAPPIDATVASAVSQYTSSGLGITFSLPNSWFGKYRVEESDGYLTVYFKPAEAIDPNVGDGEFFCIVKKTPDVDDSFYDNAQDFTVSGVAFIWGEPTDVRYSQGQPEYDTYAQMKKDFPAIFQSIRAAG